jgi:hypothetical protein
MQIADYMAGLTGKTVDELFDLNTPLVRLEQEIGGSITIVYWDVSLAAPEPTADDIATALASPTPVVVPTSVSARQFKLQLLAAGLIDEVETWVKSQSRAIQIAYQNSGSFMRTDPMMAPGFSALGFTDAQVDAFYIAAGAL